MSINERKPITIQSILFSLFMLVFIISFIPQKAAAAQISITNCSMTLAKSSYEYTAARIKPVPVIKNKESSLVQGKDFTLSYSNNLKPGRATITIQGIGKYKGKVIRPFTITKRQIAHCSITVTPSSYVYDGKTHVPGFNVRNGSVLLSKNISYTAKITNNKNVGLGKIILTGKGNYTGTHTVTFAICPQDVILLSSSVKSDSITFKWKAVANIDGYKLYKYDAKDKKYKTVNNIDKSKTSYTITGLTANTSYKYAIRAYKNANTSTVQSKSYCYINKKTAPGAVQNLKIVSVNTNSFTMSWTALSGITGYKLYRYDYTKDVFVFVKNLSKDTSIYTVTGLQEGTRYAYGVKPYRTEGSQTIISSVISKVSTTTKTRPTLYIDGDSIAYGAGSNGYSYGEALRDIYGFKLTNKSASGATLGTSNHPKWAPCSHIVDSVLANAKTKYDYAIIEGGVNDYLKSVEPGEVANSPFLNVSTTSGALEQIFLHFRTQYPDTKLYFLIPHRIYNVGGTKRNIINGQPDYFYDIMNTPNLVNKKFSDYYNIFYKVCRKYNVTIIDITKDTAFDATNESIRKEYTTNSAGLHPTKIGYTKFYVPQIVKVMGLK